MNEYIIKMMMWGNLSTNMFSTYAHICGTDIDREVLGQYGIVQKEAKEKISLEPVRCEKCFTINAPGARLCTICGRSFTGEGEDTLEEMGNDVAASPEILKKLLNDIIEEKNRKGEI